MADTNEKKLFMLFKLSDQASPKLKAIRKNFKIFMKSQNELADKCKNFGALMAVPLGGAFATVAATVKSSISTFTDYASAAQDAATKVGGTARDIQRYGYAAKMSGSSQEELNACLGIFSKNLANAVQGKNKTLVNVFKQLGISMTDANGKMRTTTELLPDIANAMRSQATESQKAYIATQLFGRGGQSLIQMLEGGAEGLNELTSEAERMGIVVDQDGVDSAKAFGDNLDRLKFSLLGVSLSIGQHIIPIIEPMINAFREWIITNREMIATAIVEYCREFAETIKQIDFKSIVTVMIDFVKKCNDIFKALGGLKTVAIAVAAIFASKLLTSIVGIVSAIGTVAKAMWALNAVLWANPIVLIIGAIVVAIGALCYGVYQIYKNWDYLCSWFSNLWDNVCEVFWSVVDWIKGVFSTAWNGCAKGITACWNFITGFFKFLWNDVCRLFWTVIDWVKGVFNSAWSSCAEGICAYWDHVTSFYKALWNGICNVFFGVVDWVRGVFTSAWNGCAEGISSYWGYLKDFYKTLWDGICGYFNWAWGIIKNVANFICDIPNQISSAFDGLISFFKEIWDGIYGTFFKPFEDMYKNIADKLETVKGWGSKVGDTVSGVWDSAKSAIGLVSDEKLTTAQAVQGATGKMEGTLDIKVHADEGVKADVEPKKDNENLNMNVQNRGALRA